MLEKKLFGWSLIEANLKNKTQRKYEFYYILRINFELISIKQTTLSKQGSDHKNTSYK